jgi:hypothetical protein
LIKFDQDEVRYISAQQPVPGLIKIDQNADSATVQLLP